MSRAWAVFEQNDGEVTTFCDQVREREQVTA